MTKEKNQQKEDSTITLSPKPGSIIKDFPNFLNRRRIIPVSRHESHRSLAVAIDPTCHLWFQQGLWPKLWDLSVPPNISERGKENLFLHPSDETGFRSPVLERRFLNCFQRALGLSRVPIIKHHCLEPFQTTLFKCCSLHQLTIACQNCPALLLISGGRGKKTQPLTTTSVIGFQRWKAVEFRFDLRSIKMKAGLTYGCLAST